MPSINKKIFKLKESKNEELKFNEANSYFIESYEMLNPGTKHFFFSEHGMNGYLPTDFNYVISFFITKYINIDVSKEINSPIKSKKSLKNESKNYKEVNEIPNIYLELYNKYKIGYTDINFGGKKHIIKGNYESFFIGNINANGVQEGKAIEIWQNGTIYDGNYDGDCFEGFGIIYFTNGVSYQGEFNLGLPNGKEDGSVYEGKWIKDKPNGFGFHILPNGTKYSGNFEEGRKNGEGEAYFFDGNYYKGDFKDDSFEGYGVYRWAIQQEYKGAFVKGKMHGEGEFNSFVGYYKGSFKKNLKHGYGEFKWKDNTKYEGYWEDNNQHGIGKLIYPDGSVVDGTWYQGNKLQRKDIFSKKTEIFGLRYEKMLKSSEK